MKKLFRNSVFYIIYSLGTLFVLPFFIGWKLYAADDLLRKIAEPAYNADNMIKAGVNVKSVWTRTIKWTYELSGEWITKKSMILKVTRLLLILTIALSVTMILYNGMMYIIQTWQGKEWKSLAQNVLLIVVGILVSLFSVMIINLIQSIPTSIEKELDSAWHKDDNKVLETGTSWKDFWNKLWDKDTQPETYEQSMAELEKEAEAYFRLSWYNNIERNEDGILIIQLNTWWYWVELVQTYLDEIGE